MSTKKEKKTKTKQARPHIAQKLVNQAEAEINITDLRNKTGLSGAGVKWYLRYLKEGLKPEEALKKAQDRPIPSLPEPRKRGAGEDLVVKQMIGLDFETGVHRDTLWTRPNTGGLRDGRHRRMG